MNSYFFVNGVEIYKFKAKDSGINASLLCLSNALQYFAVDNMKKTGYINIRMIFQLIMILLMLLIFC